MVCVLQVVYLPSFPVAGSVGSFGLRCHDGQAARDSASNCNGRRQSQLWRSPTYDITCDICGLQPMISYVIYDIKMCIWYHIWYFIWYHIHCDDITYDTIYDINVYDNIDDIICEMNRINYIILTLISWIQWYLSSYHIYESMISELRSWL